MKIVVDNKIPYIREAVGQIADEVVYLPGNSFTAGDVRDADALVIRTRTRCDRELLEGSRVKFIATATIGFDHIDVDYCREAGIAWQNCPGCNSGSVEQYLRSVLLLLKRRKGLKLEDACLGIVGAGHVGSRIHQMARSLGMRVLLNDPPRADRGEEGFVDLSVLSRQCDVITFHTPLNRTGRYNTFHLADTEFFAGLQRMPFIVNTSRGEVVDTAALLDALDKGMVGDAIIDTWENEPDIHRELLQRVFLGTPHIAGYSADGKSNATRMALEAICDFFHIQADFEIVPPDLPYAVYASDPEEAFLQVYDPTRDSDALKQHPEAFEQLRGDYPLRREIAF
ncbi:4-phosphoerythronate dehydrogenase PdxB [Phocaeicola sp.]|uniref:4-phosphoerythronate dehydrogenase PdxB n=1 Tax=Phocaeicola sp. TaxID=2773926 RepID=UPI0023BE3BA3|nr:4-phosphoerythronate dehydrogenase PdxB [Phocaeicola sp.]MDE5678476.1 4-phosphoerythronate dehydrogenase PdxB [Phocaeicola sp.]